MRPMNRIAGFVDAGYFHASANEPLGGKRKETEKRALRDALRNTITASA